MVGRGWAGAGAGGGISLLGSEQKGWPGLPGNVPAKPGGLELYLGGLGGMRPRKGVSHIKAPTKARGWLGWSLMGPVTHPGGSGWGVSGPEAQVMEGGRPAFGALCIPTSQVPLLTMKLPGVPAWIQRQHLAQSRDPPNRSALHDRQERVGGPHVLILGPPLHGPRAQATCDHAPEHQPP